MASVNKKLKNEEFTHGGAQAVPIDVKHQLERSVMSCLLWEKEHYEDGEEIVTRICKLVKENRPEDVAEIAIRAKRDMHLRHVPLLLTRELLRTKAGLKLIKEVIPHVILRPDDITELLSMYFIQKEKSRASAKLPNQLKKALAKSFEKFDEYQLAKWRGEGKSVSLKDALCLTHPKAPTEELGVLWGKLRKATLATPDTWEVELSKNKDKKEAWKRLLSEKRLGGLAFLRNIRNMATANVESSLIKEGISEIKAGKLLPINFIAAAKHNPKYESEIESKFLECFANKSKLKGKTILIVDTSGSMHHKLSNKSELLRTDVAAGLAMIAREMCEDVQIYCTAGDDNRRKHATMQIPARRGFALRDYIASTKISLEIGQGGIFLTQCLDHIKKEQQEADRIIVITDEQDCDTPERSPLNADTFGKYNYLINIASARNGIGYRKWTHIDGWSDKVLNYCLVNESRNQ